MHVTDGEVRRNVRGRLLFEWFHFRGVKNVARSSKRRKKAWHNRLFSGIVIGNLGLVGS